MPAIEQLHAGATAIATDGHIGSVIALIVDPSAAAVTHIVVSNADIPGSGRLVGLGDVTATSADQVHLDLSRAQVLASSRFVIPAKLPATDTGGKFAAYWLGPAGGSTFAVHEQLPEQRDVALRAHLRVRSREGHHIGTVAEMLVDPDSGAITGILLHEGHRFGRRDVVIPMSAISSIDHDDIWTNLDQSALDAIPVTDRP